MEPPRPVPRVAGLTPEEFERDYLSRGAPVLIEGGASEWPAREAWAPRRLRQRLASRRVKVASSERDVFGYDEAEAAYDVEEMDFADAADLITRARPTTRRYYLMQQSIPREFPELAADLPAPPYMGRAKAHPHLWFGSEGNLTPLHYDMANNLFGQLHGRKRFLMFDPAESDRLYPRPATSKHHNLSELDLERPDLERHPRFAEAHPWSCDVGAGDLLFVPAFWWHQVRSLEAGVSVSIWWAPRPAQFLAPMARRMAPALYERDRLLSLRAIVSEPGEYQGFAGMARFMEEQGQPAMALLFAGAALEDGLRMLYLKHVKPSDPAVLRDAARMADALQAVGALGAADQGAVHEWLGGIAAALAGNEVAAAPIAAILGFLDRNRR